MRFRKTLLTFVLAALTVVLASAAAASGGSDGDRGRVAAADDEILAALQRDLGLSPEQAREQGAKQARAIELDQALQVSLGDAYAGSYYDAERGTLVVNVSDDEKLEEAKASGAEARLVKYSNAELDAIKEELDVAGGKKEGSSAADRQVDGTRKASVDGMTGWYVDPKTNTVHVTVARGEAKAAAEVLAKYGDAVSIEESGDVPTPAANFMDGGDLINGSSCSAGFNLRNPSTGKGFLLTAGHCVSSGSTLTGQGGVAFGPVLESWFPTYDDALARNDSAGGFWIQGPWVDTNPSNGSFINTSGFTDGPVGTSICKSGITTKWTCGQITAKNETVTYPGSNTVFGLTRHSACVEKGDSGGANVSVSVSFSWPWLIPTFSYKAEGMTSGASLTLVGKQCLSKVGGTNVSWYFPIADSLAYYGPKYGVCVW
jgi:streptogrisin C